MQQEVELAEKSAGAWGPIAGLAREGLGSERRPKQAEKWEYARKMERFPLLRLAVVSYDKLAYRPPPVGPAVDGPAGADHLNVVAGIKLSHQGGIGIGEHYHAPFRVELPE